MNVITLFAPPDIVFAEDFRALVMPQILTLMEVSAVLIVLGHESYTDELDTIVRCAWHLGGWCLTEDIWPEVEEWISDRLLAAIDALEAEFERNEPRIIAKAIAYG